METSSIRRAQRISAYVAFSDVDAVTDDSSIDSEGREDADHGPAGSKRRRGGGGVNVPKRPKPKANTLEILEMGV
jgi:hypothetical protein